MKQALCHSPTQTYTHALTNRNRLKLAIYAHRDRHTHRHTQNHWTFKTVKLPIAPWKPPSMTWPTRSKFLRLSFSTVLSVAHSHPSLYIYWSTSSAGIVHTPASAHTSQCSSFTSRLLTLWSRFTKAHAVLRLRMHVSVSSVLVTPWPSPLSIEVGHVSARGLNFILKKNIGCALVAFMVTSKPKHNFNYDWNVSSYIKKSQKLQIQRHFFQRKTNYSKHCVHVLKRESQVLWVQPLALWLRQAHSLATWHTGQWEQPDR